jgi:hypothetical protein
LDSQFVVRAENNEHEEIQVEALDLARQEEAREEKVAQEPRA